MTHEDLNFFDSWFTRYVSGYYTDNHTHNDAMHLKEDHTRRVRRNIIMLARSLDLPIDDIFIAETIALFHDVGRFEQFKQFGTFKDSASVNHAKLGLRQLSAAGILNRCTIKEKRFIAGAIAGHNALNLPVSSNEKALMFMKLIRDADKLDIWHVMIAHYKQMSSVSDSTIVIGLPDTPQYSQHFIESLQAKMPGRMENLKTVNDFKLLQISWVFDLNYTAALKHVSEKKIIDRIAATLPQSKDIIMAVQSVRDYISQNIKI
ncbi:MAG: HD domain-containing protein [Desulfobacterales bacterium]|nr:HD domain-containing protein [Desulfobacterales bacterium]